MIEAHRIARAFRPGGQPPLVALAGVTFTARAGRIVGLLGPNGAGKTTLFRILAGLLRPDSGRATVAGFDPRNHPRETRQSLGFLTEQPGLPDRLSPLWHVSLHGVLHGLDRRASRERSRLLLERLGLGSRLSSRCGALSKGQQLKVALARALVHEPAALLLDEPTTGLDVEVALEVRAIARERAARGAAILWATHSPHEAERLCDEILILGRGLVLAAGSPESLRRSWAQGVMGTGSGSLSLEEVYVRIQQAAG